MHVEALFVHPVKAARAVAVDRAELCTTGFRHDRAFMIVDENGAFLTQRELPILARLDAVIAGGVLRLRGDDGRSVDVLLSAEGSAVSVEIWGESIAATDCGASVAGLLTNFAGTTARLVRMRDGFARGVDPLYAATGDTVSFADGFPLLVTTSASVAAARDAIGEMVDVRRFRPNIVVSGAASFAEDDWQRISIGETVIDLVKPCSRCNVLDVDPDQGRRTDHVLKALGRIRTIGKKVLFGQNGIPRVLGTISVGDAVEVVRASP